MITDTYTTDYSNYNNSSTFHGLVFNSDFCTDYPRHSKSLSWADRIASDIRFNEQCKKSSEDRDRKRKDI